MVRLKPTVLQATLAGLFLVVLSALLTRPLNWLFRYHTCMDKVDASKLGAYGCEALHKVVMRLHLQSGMSAVELTEIAGVHVRTEQKWLWMARAKRAGSLVETSRRRPHGACGNLTMAQDFWGTAHRRCCSRATEPAFCAMGLAGDPSLDGNPFGLLLSDRLVGKYLLRWGYPAQRRVKKAIE